jgi:hypothetical protein
MAVPHQIQAVESRTRRGVQDDLGRSAGILKDAHRDFLEADVLPR